MKMKKKKAIRQKFRNDCLLRDNNKCKVCGETADLAVHHIIDRNEITNGGYIKENGITLCEECHIKAEEYHITHKQIFIDNYHPNDLFGLINSSYELAIKLSKL